MSTDDSRDSSSGDEDIDGIRETLDSIPDEDEEGDDALMASRTSNATGSSWHSNQQAGAPNVPTRPGSEAPSLIQDKGTSPTPSTEGSITYSLQHASRNDRYHQHFPSSSGPAGMKHKWAHLSADVQFYLAYFYENITYMHYSLKYDPHDFLHTDLLETALYNEALLFGIVGFSAFQRTLHHVDGRIEHFLPYYNKAVSLLLSSLRRGEKHEIGILMAILQLTTIEVCRFM